MEISKAMKKERQDLFNFLSVNCLTSLRSTRWANLQVVLNTHPKIPTHNDEGPEPPKLNV